MGKYKSYVLVIVSILISICIVVVLGFKDTKGNPNEVYKVYIDGKFIGAIKSKKSLEDYINNEQRSLKNEYKVDKVYIPNGIDIEKTMTFDGKILSEKKIYKKIKAKKSFTIKGYVVTISKEKEKDIKLYLLKKNLFDKSVKNVLNAFVKSEEVKNYKND